MTATVTRPRTIPIWDCSTWNEFERLMRRIASAEHDVRVRYLVEQLDFGPGSYQDPTPLIPILRKWQRGEGPTDGKQIADRILAQFEIVNDKAEIRIAREFDWCADGPSGSEYAPGTFSSGGDPQYVRAAVRRVFGKDLRAYHALLLKWLLGDNPFETMELTRMEHLLFAIGDLLEPMQPDLLRVAVMLAKDSPKPRWTGGEALLPQRRETALRGLYRMGAAAAPSLPTLVRFIEAHPRMCATSVFGHLDTACEIAGKAGDGSVFPLLERVLRGELRPIDPLDAWCACEHSLRRTTEGARLLRTHKHLDPNRN